jgi:hypothetical protein
MDLTLQQTTFGLDERDWLGSAHGTDMLASVTLDTSTFVANTHYPKGVLNSGILLGKITASGLYGPYDDTANDGRQTAVGVLFTETRVIPLGASAASAKVSGPLFRHGKVVTAKLPANSGVDANGKADLTQILFV